MCGLLFSTWYSIITVVMTKTNYVHLLIECVHKFLEDILRNIRLLRIIYIYIYIYIRRYQYFKYNRLFLDILRYI